jgi:hypothetical protein
LPTGPSAFGSRDHDPATFRRRAERCREEARATEHNELSTAFTDLAAVLGVAASIIDMIEGIDHRTLH